MPYIPRNTQHYEYARRIAKGENAGKVIRDLGTDSQTVCGWRRELREQAEREFGFAPPYITCATLATAQEPIRSTLQSAIIAYYVFASKNDAESPPH